MNIERKLVAALCKKKKNKKFNGEEGKSITAYLSDALRPVEEKKTRRPQSSSPQERRRAPSERRKN